MNYFMKMSLALFSIFMIVLLISCGASHHLRNEIIYKDDSFVYDNLKNNGLIIGGFSSQRIQFTREDRIKYSSILSNMFLEKLTDAHTINVISTLQLINQIDKENYFSMMEMFDLTSKFGKDYIHAIRGSIPEAHYFLLANLENENVIDNSFEEYIEDSDGEEKLQTEYQKTYLITINFQLYDLNNEKLVWNDRIFNEAERTESRTTRTGCVESCMDDLIQSLLFGEPAEINREEVLAKITEKLTKDLAKTQN